MKTSGFTTLRVLLFKVFSVVLSIVLVSASLITANLLLTSCSLGFPAHTKTITPGQWGLAYRDASFKTDDGITIKSWIIEQNPHNPWIIFVTGLAEPRYSRNTRLVLASLVRYKYNFLILFPRGYNGSGGVTSCGFLEKKDILAAISHIRHKNYQGKIGVVGFSQGAVASLGAASESDEIKALALFAPYAAFENEVVYAIDFFFKKKKKNKLAAFIRAHPGLFCLFFERIYRVNLKRENPVKTIKRIKAPILLGHGKNDSLIPYHNGQILAKSSNKVEFITLAKGHTIYYQDKHERAYFISRIIRVMNKNLW